MTRASTLGMRTHGGFSRAITAATHITEPMRFFCHGPHCAGWNPWVAEFSMANRARPAATQR